MLKIFQQKKMQSLNYRRFPPWVLRFPWLSAANQSGEAALGGGWSRAGAGAGNEAGTEPQCRAGTGRWQQPLATAAFPWPRPGQGSCSSLQHSPGTPATPPTCRQAQHTLQRF